jgi:SAM-dependent methyltransferase
MSKSNNADYFVEIISTILSTTNRARVDRTLYSELESALHSESTSVSHWNFLADISSEGQPLKVLDFGCGQSDLYRNRINSIGHQWTGLDIPDSIESIARESSDDVILYDGGVIPVADEEFDVVLSLQTFEHVQNLDLTFSEIHRVLKKGGHLIGAVSNLEAFHSMSTFNFTPYGLKTISQRNGMRLNRVHPQIDGLSLIFRGMMMSMGDPASVEKINGMFNDSSPINLQFQKMGKERGLTNKEINSWRLQFCGQFSFDIEKEH